MEEMRLADERLNVLEHLLSRIRCRSCAMGQRLLPVPPACGRSGHAEVYEASRDLATGAC